MRREILSKGSKYSAELKKRSRYRFTEKARVSGGQIIDIECVFVAYRNTMIVSFKHKGLEAFYQAGALRGIQAKHSQKLAVILDILDAAPDIEAVKKYRFLKAHPLKGKLNNYYSVWVNGNWRVIFKTSERGFEVLDYLDYH